MPVKPGAYFLYFDPLRTLDEVQQHRWQVVSERRQMIETALEEAGANRTMTRSRELISRLNQNTKSI